MRGWLADQLPNVLSSDDFTRRFVGIFEPTADSIRDQIEALEYFIDVDTAPEEFVRWLGSWLGASVNASWSLERQREVVRTVGREFPRRGTRLGLERVLSAITGSDAQVIDGGGVWRAGSTMPFARRLSVTLGADGGLADHQLYELIAREVPIGVSFDLTIANRAIAQPARELRDMEGIMGSDAEQ